MRNCYPAHGACLLIGSFTLVACGSEVGEKPVGETTTDSSSAATTSSANSTSSTSATNSASSNPTSGVNPAVSASSSSSGVSPAVGPSSVDPANTGAASSTASGSDSDGSDETTSASDSTEGDSSSGATSSDVEPGVAPGAISDLMIEANPNSTISCIVTWTTETPGTSTVQFGVDDYVWEITDEEPATEHRVVVIGMHAEETYKVKAISSGGGATVEGESTFTTGALPASIPVGTVMINDAAESQPGWTLMNVQKGDGSTSARSPSPPMAVMYDAEGKPVWYFINGTVNDRGGAVSTQMTDVGVLMGPSWNESLKTGTVPREVDFEGNVVWECPASLCGSNTSFSHHASKLPNGHYLLNEDVGSGTTHPRIHELDENGDEVWTLDWTDISPEPSGSSGDWCHGNSISADLDKDILWVNCRWVGFMQVNYAAKTKDWLIPAAYGSKGQGDFTYDPPEIQFSDAHDPEFHEDDNTVLMFDNGGYGTGATGGSTAMYRSRAVEYKVDTDTMTLTLNWEFPGNFDVPDAWYTDNWYTPFWGDADRLPNGNVLVAAGIRSPTVESRVFEVTKADGKVVWEFRFPADYGVYRADRVTPPLVKAIEQ